MVREDLNHNTNASVAFAGGGGDPSICGNKKVSLNKTCSKSVRRTPIKLDS